MIKLKLRELSSIREVLTALGQLKVVTEVKQFPGKYANGVRWTITKNLGMLNRELDVVNENRLDMRREYVTDNESLEVEERKEEKIKFLCQYNDFLNEVHEFPLLTINHEDLNMDENRLDPSLIEPLIAAGIVTCDSEIPPTTLKRLENTKTANEPTSPIL